MKTVRVVAAVICSEDKVLSRAGGYGALKGQWKLLGVELKEGETLQKALVDEIKEGLKAEIEVGELIDTIDYDYPNFHLSMDCFWARVISGEHVFKETADAKWFGKEELDGAQWQAEITLIEKIKEELLLQSFLKIGKWDFDFENQETASDCEQSYLSRVVFKKIFNRILDESYDCYLVSQDKIALYVNQNNYEKSFLFDVMHNPKESHQPYMQAKKLGKIDKITFNRVYHSIGNFAPVPRTVISHYYGPNLQFLHNYMNELWLWFLKYLKDNWTEWPTKVDHIISFKIYMKCSCQHLYYQEIFNELYEQGVLYKLDEINWIEKVKQWNALIDRDDFDETLISFNQLFDKGNIAEIDNQINFLIEARGRCILSLIK